VYEEMKNMRKQFERVLGVQLSDKARKRSRAHVPAATVDVLDHMTSRNSCCFTLRKCRTRKRQPCGTAFMPNCICVR